MWTTILIGLLFILLLRKILRSSDGDLHKIPGPSTLSLWWSMINGDARKADIRKGHLAITEMAKVYGPIMKIPELSGRPTVVVNDFAHIYQVLVTSGKDIGGRIDVFRAYDIMGHTGILQNQQPDLKWKTLRKITHGHLRQFGEGLTRLQSLLSTVAEDMFSEFACNEGVPMETYKAISETALKSISFLVTGHVPTSHDPIVDLMRKIEELSREILTITPSLSLKILDAFPWIRHTGLSSGWKKIQELVSLENVLMEHLDDLHELDPEAESLYKIFKNRLESPDEDGTLTKKDMIKTITNLLIAGVVTSSDTFHVMINLLAHNPHIQDKMYEEILKVVPEGEITVLHRHKLIYCKAVLLETFRIHTAIPYGVPRTTCTDTKIGEYLIPAKTNVMMSMWNLNHDPEFWKDPKVFRPERFLDDNGEVVDVDHPKRQRLMPFGAGLRVCVAESMATVRQFLWSTTLVKRFKVKPAPGNTMSLTDPKSYNFEGVMRSLPYEVIFQKRN